MCLCQYVADGGKSGGRCARNPDFAHPVLMIIRNCSLICGSYSQRVIYQRGKQLFAVLEEQALRTWFGTAETQAGQLDRLLALMSLPTVSLGIIPMMTERTAVGSAGFWIFDNSLVALETPTASIEATRPQEIEL
jgi:Domain of unknown function (DUF5753)